MRKTWMRALAGLVLAAALGAVPVMAAADSIESEIELLRTDIKSSKVEIVKKAIDVQGAKADAFWPLYRQYQADSDKIGDQRLALIKDYAANYKTMTDEKARTLTTKALDLQVARVNLLKKYYKNFEKVLGATDAARLVQVEHLVNSLMDIQVAASIPLIEKPVAAAPSP